MLLAAFRAAFLRAQRTLLRAAFRLPNPWTNDDSSLVEFVELLHVRHHCPWWPWVHLSQTNPCPWPVGVGNVDARELAAWRTSASLLRMATGEKPEEHTRLNTPSPVTGLKFIQTRHPCG